MSNILLALKDDNYLRVLDLRKNKFTSAVLKETNDYNLLKSMQRNEAITNIDLRDNDGFNKELKFQLSLCMIRNIDLLRKQGVMVQGSWFNRHVLMLNETINGSAKRDLMKGSDGGSLNTSPSPKKKGEDKEDDSIFNIEFADIPGKVESQKSLQSVTYQTKKRSDSVKPK